MMPSFEQTGVYAYENCLVKQ